MNPTIAYRDEKVSNVLYSIYTVGHDAHTNSEYHALIILHGRKGVWGPVGPHAYQIGNDLFFTRK